MDRMIPDRVNLDSSSPHFWPDYRKLGVKIDGVVRNGDVHEFCVSEGWAMVRKRTRWGYVTENGRYVVEKVTGRIEPYLLKEPGTNVIDLAEAKRARKAAKRLRVSADHAPTPSAS